MIVLDPVTKGILYGVAIMAAFLVVAALAWREIDRTYDRVIVLNRKTRKPYSRRVKILDGEFSLKFPGGEERVVRMPEGIQDWKQDGKGSVVIITETGHVLGISPEDMTRKLAEKIVTTDNKSVLYVQNSIDNPKLRPYDASLYAKVIKTVLAKKAITSFDDHPKSAFNGRLALIVVFVVIAGAAAAYFMHQKGVF